MQKTLLVKLVEEYYGAGKSERVYGRLAEEMRLVGRSTWMPLWRCVAAMRQEFGPENVLALGSTNDSLLACLLGATSRSASSARASCAVTSAACEAETITP